jgi:ferredoxin-thioredoxin reductase catalytic chain
VELKKDADKTRAFARMVAQKQGWEIGPDASLVEMLVEGLTVNYNRYGYYLCPCRDSDGSREADRDAICPCVYARADIEDYGHCYCSLYASKSFLDSGAEATGIPDRRRLG